MEAFPFFNQILHTRRIDRPVMMWFQIHARGGGGPSACSPEIFLLKGRNLGHPECSKIHYYQPRNQPF